MTEYPLIEVQTPGKKWVKAHVVNPKHPVSCSGGRMAKVPLLDNSGIHFLAEIIKERIDHNRDCPILVTGERGVGKSTTILKTALDIDPDFNIDNITFQLEDFAKRFEMNPQGNGKKGIYPQVSLDEAGHALFAQDWMKRAQKELAKQLIINRIQRQIIWFAVPTREDLNSRVRNMPFLWVHLQEPDDYLQGYAEVHIGHGTPQSKWFKEKYWLGNFAFIHTDLTGDFWDKYEIKKIDFVKQVTKDTSSGKADNLVNIIRQLKAKGFSQIEIGEIVDRDQSRISRMLNENPL